LELDRTSSSAWNLLALLLSANKQYKLAFTACSHALRDDPLSSSLLITKANLELALNEPAKALQTYRLACSIYASKLQHEPQDPESSEAHPQHSFTADSLSFDASSVDTGRRHKRNVSVELSDHSYSQAEESSRIIVTADVVRQKTKLWLSAAEAFIQAGQFLDAMECLQEAKALDSTNADIFYQEGYMMEMQELHDDALVQYQKALVVEGEHINTNIRMAVFAWEQNKDPVLAENILGSVLRLDPSCHQAWFQMGQVMKQMAASKPALEAKAAECFTHAIELEATAPVLPFSSISREVP